ncbi:hypothetical protein J3R83DRAFT_9414 [Lanmaoa asiatica]|nr:hypothetical protein J3R83DRAFT_9414 [Lanmaoa asiatica]
MLGTSPIINVADGLEDTPFADLSDAFSKCRPAQPGDLPFCLRELPRPTLFRFRRTFPDHPHMQLSRDLFIVDSYADTVIVAVCVSLGGTGIVAMAIYVIVMCRRRRKLLDAQDTLPRPFEVTVPAATATSTSMMTHNLTSPPTLGNPPRIYSQNGRRWRFQTRRKEFSARIKPPRAGSAPTSTTITPSQSQPDSSSNTRMQSHLSDTVLLSNHAGPSSHRTPSRSSTHPHTLTVLDPHPQSSSRVQLGRSSSSPPTGTQPQRTAGVSASRSASVRERHSAKHALCLSRSASELYRTTSSVPCYRVPEFGLHTSSGIPAHRHDGRELHVNTFPRPTNHLRHWHSALPVARAQHVRSDSGEDVGGTIIFQHQDAGVMQELPPPYHKLVRSGPVV